MEKKTVLIVEDDKNTRELYESAISMAGHNVLTADEGEKGVELALAHHPDLILMDVMMPHGMGGHDAVAKIREDDWGKNAHVVHLTNRIDPQDLVDAKHLDTDEYIIKTHTPIKELVEKVEEHLRRGQTS